MVLMTQANGLSKIKENIFENRFMHVPELKRMGAKIEIKNKTAYIYWTNKINWCRSNGNRFKSFCKFSFSWIDCKNRTIINRIYHLDRGYEFLENKLKKL